MPQASSHPPMTHVFIGVVAEKISEFGNFASLSSYSMPDNSPVSNTMPEMENVLYEMFATFKAAVQAALRHSCSQPSKCLQNHTATYIFLNSKTSFAMYSFSPKYSSFDPRVFELPNVTTSCLRHLLGPQSLRKEWP
jgi:hypothetical protein